MKTSFKVLVSLFVMVMTIGIMSISAYAATMFSLGEPTIDDGYITVPVYLETTDYDYIGGYHFYMDFPESYVLDKDPVDNKIVNKRGSTLGTIVQNEIKTGRLTVAWAYGDNLATSGKIELCDVYFINDSVKDVSTVLSDISIRPQQLTYIANVGDTSINNGNGTKAIMDITEAATYITYDIPKELEGWENGCIEKLYLSGTAGTVEINNIIDNDEYYTVIIKLRLDENDNKVITDFTLLADTSDTVGGQITAEGVILKKFSSVVVENMNIISD